MKTYIGIDLGTSGVKILLVDNKGKILKEVNKEYLVVYPKSGWSEQDPKQWYNKVIEGLKELLENQDKTAVCAISFGGQMHGLVALDKNNEVIRNAILWNDGRCQKQVDYLNNNIGKEKLVKLTGNFAFAGFTAPKIMWLKENEKDNFDKINMILLPKDYLAFKFSNVYSSDYSDASGTLLLDVKNKCWSRKMCEIVGISMDKLPKLYESYETVGLIKKELAEKLNISSNVKIVAGAGDNAAAAIGTGCVFNNSCNISLGTSGTVFASSNNYMANNKVAIHSFNHATGKYHLMGCILSAASCNKWWVEDILKSSHSVEQKNIEKYIGENNVFFLPYLMGERCPHNDTNIRGAFLGLSANTKREEMTLAVLEGVAYALKDCLEIIKECGIDIKESTLCGGGAKSKIWAQIIANVLNIKINFVETEQGPGYGAAILAMVGEKEYNNVEEAVSSIVKVTNSIYPNENISKKYAKKYEAYKEIYPNIKNIQF